MQITSTIMNIECIINQELSETVAIENSNPSCPDCGAKGSWIVDLGNEYACGCCDAFWGHNNYNQIP